MKKNLFICLSLCILFSKANGQMRDTTLNTNTHKVDASSLFQKSKKQKTTAWIMLGGGAGIAIAGLAIISHDASWNTSQDVAATITTIFTIGFVTPKPVVYKHSTAGPILAIAGAGAMLGSIPLFISAGKNKTKANLILKNENVFFNPHINIKEQFVSLGISINL